MPANPASLKVTERYRRGMVGLRRKGQTEAKRVWSKVSPDDIDGTFQVGQLALTVSTLQKEATRLSSAYLASFVASELGEPESPPPLMVPIGTFNGNPLKEGLRSAAIKAKIRIGEGMAPREAVNASRATLVATVGLFIDTAARESLQQGMVDDERIEGYKRAIKGTCAACAGMADGAMAPAGTPLEIHPDCQCVSEAVVRPPQPNAVGTPAPLTPAETKALSEYIEGAPTPNPALRAGRKPSGVDDLDALIAQQGEDAPVLHRFIDRQQLSTDDLAALSEGKTFADRGYWSTTSDQSFVEEFARLMADDPIFFKVRGARGLNVDKAFDVSSVLPSGKQAEWILPRSGQYKVVSVKGNVVTVDAV